MKLRFTPKELCMEAAAYFRSGSHSGSKPNSWTKVNDGYWYWEDERYNKLRLSGKYNRLYRPDEHLRAKKEVVRVAETKDGVMCIHESYYIKSKPLQFKEKNRELFKQGYVSYNYESSSQNRLFIKNNGVISLKAGGMSRYISMSMFLWFTTYVGSILTKKLLTIRENSEWLLPLLPERSMQGVSMELIRSCNSLQDLVDKINFLEVPVNANLFKGVTMDHIFEKMNSALFIENPMDYLKDTNSLIDTNVHMILTEAIQNAAETGTKVFYNPGKFVLSRNKAGKEELQLF